MRSVVRQVLQRGFARFDELQHELLEIRSGDPLARRFAAFGTGSRIAAPRARIVNPRGVSIGDDVTILPLVGITVETRGGGVGLHIGNRVVIGHGTWLVATNGIHIGDDCGIGHGVVVVDASHDWQATRASRAPHQAPLVAGPPLRIGPGALISSNCVIASTGITVGARAIVGPNTVVNRDVPPDTMIVGNPPRRVPYPTDGHERDLVLQGLKATQAQGSAELA